MRAGFKHLFFLFGSCILFLQIVFCTKDSATDPDANDYTGIVTGYVYSKLDGLPLNNVTVSIDGDSAVPDITDDAGYFSIAEVKSGDHKLQFSHPDHENANGVLVKIKNGTSASVDTVRLPYKWYIIKGTVKTKTGEKAVGAGVVIANTPYSTIADTSGVFVIDKIAKNDSYRLVCARSGDGFNIVTPIKGINNDTTILSDIRLLLQGATVSGTVFDTLNKPVTACPVSAISGGLRDTTTNNGAYTLYNIPSNEPSVNIIAREKNGMIGGISGMELAEGGFAPSMNIYLRKASDFKNGMAVEASDLLVADTAKNITLSVLGLSNGETVIESYEWFISGGVNPDTVTDFPTLQIAASKVSALAPGLKDIPVRVSAKNSADGYSNATSFKLSIRSVTPQVKAQVAIAPDSLKKDTLTIEKGNMVYLSAKVTAPFGGVDTMLWKFGDETPAAVLVDSIVEIGHMFDSIATYHVVFVAVSGGGKQVVLDTVVVNITKPIVDAPVLVAPQDKDTVRISGDSITLVWNSVKGSNVKYTVYADPQNTLPVKKVAEEILDTTLRIKVADSTRYYWTVETVAGSSRARSAAQNFYIRTTGEGGNTPPEFISKSIDMRDTGYTGKTYYDTLHAKDADHDSLRFALVDMVVGMSLTDSIITWTPGPTENGVNDIKVSVSDGKKSATLSWKITIVKVPVITRNPVSVVVVEGKPLTLTTGASGDSLKYKWQKGEATIAGATDSIYKVLQVTTAHAGLYRCIVYNSFGADTTDTVRVTITPFVAPVIYVKAGSPEGGDGTTWEKAFSDLQKAINKATRGTQVWVAAGTYKPDTTGKGREASFSMKDEVGLYGGFTGTETSLLKRDWETNRTILSGDIGVPDDSSDNCYHVIYNTPSLGITESAVLDGFVVCKGGIYGGSTKGGGMYNDGAWPIVRSCRFENNSNSNGGAMYNTNSARVRVENTIFYGNNSFSGGGGAVTCENANASFYSCTFENNVANLGMGGGLYSRSSNIVVEKCIFRKNTAFSGCGMYVDNASAVRISMSTFLNNSTSTSTARGGGIYLYNCKGEVFGCTFRNNSSYYGGALCLSMGKPVVTSSTFENNFSSGYGSAVLAEGSFPCVANCTFVNNSAALSGTICGSGFSRFVLVNTIFRSNTMGSGDFSDISHYTQPDTMILLNNAFAGGCPAGDLFICSGTTPTDPLVSPPSDNGGDVLTSALGAGSPAIDAGVYVYQDDDGTIIYNQDGGTTYKNAWDGTAYIPKGTVKQLNATDARGVKRPQGAGIDLGAYEKE